MIGFEFGREIGCGFCPSHPRGQYSGRRQIVECERHNGMRIEIKLDHRFKRRSSPHLLDNQPAMGRVAAINSQITSRRKESLSCCPRGQHFTKSSRVKCQVARSFNPLRIENKIAVERCSNRFVELSESLRSPHTSAVWLNKLAVRGIFDHAGVDLLFAQILRPLLPQRCEDLRSCRSRRLTRLVRRLCRSRNRSQPKHCTSSNLPEHPRSASACPC